MRGYKTLIQEAELMALPPEAVSEFLKRRADQSKAESYNDPVDEEAERALLSRKDPLIDLALARYSPLMAITSELFQAAAPKSPIRLACLANRASGREILRPFPVWLWGREFGAMGQWLSNASDEELTALFENPNLGDGFLRALLERSEGFESTDEERLCRFVSILHRNPRMRTPRAIDSMDGFAEYTYAAVFNAAWKLAETAPTTEAWAASLGWLYEQLQPEAFSIEDPLSLAARWQLDPRDAERAKRQERDHELGYLSHWEQVRKGLARLALRKNSKLLPELVASEDLALRAAVYAAGSINAEQLREAYERDGEIAFNESVSNLALWQRQETREALREIAWALAQADKHADLLAADHYRWMDEDLRQKHPDWFLDQDEPDQDPQAAASKEDVAILASHLEQHGQGLAALRQALRDLMSRSWWIWWFSLGALVASLRHF